jgi:hypothetical protein
VQAPHRQAVQGLGDELDVLPLHVLHHHDLGLGLRYRDAARAVQSQRGHHTRNKQHRVGRRRKRLAWEPPLAARRHRRGAPRELLRAAPLRGRRACPAAVPRLAE